MISLLKNKYDILNNFKAKSDALKRQKEIKNKKSRKYIEYLIKK